MRDRIYQLSPPRKHPVSSILVGDMHLRLILRVSNKNSAQIFEGNNISTQPRRSVSPDALLIIRLQPATGSAPTSLVSPACRIDSPSALRSRSSCSCRITHCLQLVFHTSISSVLSDLVNASRSYLGIKHNSPISIELYRLSTAGPVVSAPRTSPRRHGVRLSSMRQFLRYHTGKCQAIRVRPSRPFLRSSPEPQTEKKVELPSQQFLRPSNTQWYNHSGT